MKLKTLGKRMLVLAAAALMVLSLALLCSCNKKRVLYPNEPITLPLEETYTLSYWLRFDNSFMPDYTDFNDHPYYKWLEEKTNIHIDFQVPTATATSDAELIGAMLNEWNTRIASGDMTEMVEHYYFVPSLEGDTIDSAADEEMYYVLNEYVDVQMDNFNALREQYGVIDKLMLTPYGNIMFIPKVTGIEDENKGTPIKQGLVIRKDFLDEYMLDVPVTVADWENVLDKFQMGGVQNPMMYGTMALDATLGGDPFLSAYGVSYKFHIKEGSENELAYGCVTEGMREYVTLLNSWVTKGYLNVTVNPTAETKLSDSVGAFYATLDEMVNYNAMAQNPDYELVACPYPVLNEGDTIDVYDTYMPIGNREVNATYITYACESPALAAKWLDQNFSSEAYARASYGEKGVDYTETDNGVAFTESITGHADGAIYGYQRRCLATAYYADRDAVVNYIYTDEQKKAIETWSNVSRERSVIRTTSMNLTEEEAEEMAAIDNFFFIQYSLRDFIRGSKPLEDWDAYIAQMNEQGFDDYLAIEQSAWDRYLAG